MHLARIMFLGKDFAEKEDKREQGILISFQHISKNVAYVVKLAIRVYTEIYPYPLKPSL